MDIIKKGTVVRHVAPVVEGVVLDTRFNSEQEQLEYLVSYSGQDGERHERWFLASEVAPKAG